MQVAPVTALSPYHEPANVKRPRLLAELNELTHWHYDRCEGYRRILDVAYGGKTQSESLERLPVLPVRLFKTIDLASIPSIEIVKTLTSSGTTSQRPSKIILDKATAMAQTRALASIMKSFLGPKRLPMAIADSPGVLRNREEFSARGAGIIGFSQFGHDHVYLLDEDMQLNWTLVEQFLAQHAGTTVLLFGFTFMVWQYLYKAAVIANRKLDFGDSILIHGGGWKKLKDQQVSNDDFKARLREQLGVRRIYNYYGMVEQTGSIFMECEQGHFHAPCYADIITRDPVTLAPLSFGQKGILQLMSNIPRSYPGHVLISEDLGTLVGEDDCPCGRAGRYFTVDGRLPEAELRGCSDTHQEKAPA